ncbi:MAG TPA: heme-degrading domain-containing protein [Cellvibrio sp.]|nr:heme-degrading domain-containing protein [Cellvibrio sp.]
MNQEVLNKLLTQESELELPYFNNETAWELGTRIKQAAEKLSVSVAIEVYAFEHVLFCYFMPGTTKDNHDWVRRKRQSVMRFGHSSYYQGQYNAMKNRDFEMQPHIDPREYCAHGGSFPIRIKNSGIIGAVTVSGLPQEIDHQLAVDAMQQLLTRIG